MEDSQGEKHHDDRPGDEGGGLVKVVNGTLRDVKAALDHGDGVQGCGQEQEQIIDPVILAKPLSPQKDRVSRAQAVDDGGEQKKMAVSKPRHLTNIIAKAG